MGLPPVIIQLLTISVLGPENLSYMQMHCLCHHLIREIEVTWDLQDGNFQQDQAAWKCGWRHKITGKIEVTPLECEVSTNIYYTNCSGLKHGQSHQVNNKISFPVSLTRQPAGETGKFIFWMEDAPVRLGLTSAPEAPEAPDLVEETWNKTLQVSMKMNKLLGFKLLEKEQIKSQK